MSKVSESQKAASARYDKKTYSRIKLMLRKDAETNLDVIRAHAKECDESTNGFILRAIAETIERDRNSVSEKS